MNDQIRRIEKALDRFLPETDALYKTVTDAMRYSLLNGGKRVRAVLALEFCKLCGGTEEEAMPFACAVEMVHAYSLIHDDLPCMDNDDMRRGRPSCHRQFDEATALLAADALVTAAFEAVANAPLPAESRAEAAAVLAKAAGARGMLYGQELDKRFEREPAGEAQLLELHRHKTGALILAAVQMGCAAAADAGAARTPLEQYASEIGLVFQIVDDVLDVTSDAATLGKPIGSDAENGKTTFVSLYGLDGARRLAAQHNDAALAALAPLGEAADFLRQLACGLLERRK